jgi:AcrR family transcriptional regulator
MDNRSNLMEQALDLFSSRGYDAVGIQEICESANLTKPTLYHYFTSKRGLLQALLEHHYEPLLSALELSSIYEHDITFSLDKVISTYFAYSTQNISFYRWQLAMQFAPQESEPHQAVLPYSKRQFRLLENLFRQAEADHGNMRGRSEAYAATFLGMINTYINLSYEHQLDLNADLVHRLQHQFMHGIFS